MNITINQAIEKIDNLAGQIFTVEFITKQNELRSMNCRKQVTKHLKGGKLKFNPLEKGLLPVFDMYKQGYRFINLNTLQSLHISGTKYSIT